VGLRDRAKQRERQGQATKMLWASQTLHRPTTTLLSDLVSERMALGRTIEPEDLTT